MAAASAAAMVSPTLGNDRRVGKLRHKGRLIDALMPAAHNIWQRKTAHCLAEITGVSIRTAERWLSGDVKISGDALCHLLRSEYGMSFLAAVMVGAQPQWWRRVKKASALGEMRRQKQKLQEAINEIAELDDDLARAEAALPHGDEDFHRPHLEALRQTSRR